MTFTRGSGPLEMSSSAADIQPISPKQAPAQEKKRGVLVRLRRQRHVEHLHRLGPSPLGHFIKDIEKGADIDATLEAYAKLDADFIKALGGDRFAPSLWPIDGGAAMILGLISGTIFREVAQRTSKAGKPYIVTTIRLKDGDGWQFVRATAFSESAQADLMRLSDSDALAVTGPLKAEFYTAQNGETKIALSIIADKVLPLRQHSKEREVKPSGARSRRERQAGIWQPGAGPNDPIPF